METLTAAEASRPERTDRRLLWIFTDLAVVTLTREGALPGQECSVSTMLGPSGRNLSSQGSIPVTSGVSLSVLYFWLLPFDLPGSPLAPTHAKNHWGLQ